MSEAFVDAASDAACPDDSLQFFDRVLTGDDDHRAAALEDISKQLRASCTDDPNHCLFFSQFPNILRFSTACPFSDIRLTCARLLAFASTHIPSIAARVTADPICLYLPRDSIPTVGWAAHASAPAEVVEYPVCSDCGQRHAPDDNSAADQVAAEASVDVQDPLLSERSRPEPAESVRPLFEDLFLTAGRISNLDQVLAMMPDFFSPAANTLHFVMREQGPLPLPWRNYLALLASSQFRCDSLMSQQRMEFLINNGDPRWLAGAAAAPTKIQNLLELNARLAHQPWTIQCDLITKLLKGSDAWSVAELVHAIVILTTYHFLSCVSHGVGIATDNDLLATPGATFADAVQPPKEAPSDGQTISPPGSNSGTRRTGTRLAQLLTSNLESLVADVSSLELEAEVDPASIPISIAPVSMPSEHRSPLTPQSIQLPAVAPSPATEPSSTVQPVAESVPAASPVSDAIPFPAPSPPTASQSPTAISIPAAAPWLIGNHISSYVDFDMKKCELLREQDYSWKEHGFALVNRFYLGAGPLLDAELDLIFDYTENNLGDGQEQLQNVDTGPFRRAIWYYAHRMFGMVAADFDYRQVNVFLSRPLKAFIKRVVCFPHTISAAEFDEALSGTYSFRPSEKLHIVLLASEGRRQACLLHGLKAVMAYMLS